MISVRLPDGSVEFISTRPGRIDPSTYQIMRQEIDFNGKPQELG